MRLACNDRPTEALCFSMEKVENIVNQLLFVLIQCAELAEDDQKI